MLRQRRVVSGELIRRENYTKSNWMSRISGFQNKNPREIPLIGLKHINLKEASDAIRQQFGENKRLRFSKQSFRK
jgi:DNA polymerase-3 subunit alpha